MESPTYAIVDLETTGHAPAKGDRMIQIAIVFVKDWIIQKKYSTFIHPNKNIPAFIQQLTNITDEDVINALPFEHHADEIYEMLKDCIFVAHNTDFDYSFLQEELKRANSPQLNRKKIDTVELSKIVFPTSYSYKLQDIATELDISLERAHRADDDAFATAELFIKCMNEIRKLPFSTLEQLHKRSFLLKSDLSHLFYEALKEKRVKNEKEQFEYYKGIALHSKANELAAPGLVIDYPSEHAQKEKMFLRAFPHFEVREAQFELMDHVWNALQIRQEIVAEASTGIGKTLAYLVPAAIYAKQTNRQVVVSTYTTHLLDQLYSEELSKANAILNTSIKSAILKGMHHYIDLHRFEELLTGSDESYDETFTLLQILVWLTKTLTGDVNELNVSGGGQFFIDKIRKRNNVIRSENERQHDFYEYALKKSREAELIITNHSMILSELNRQEPLLLNIGGWIIDEAHQFVQAAISREERIFSYTHYKYIFGQIGTFDDGQLLHSFMETCLTSGIGNERLLDELNIRFTEILRTFDHAIESIMNSLLKKKKKSSQSKKTYLLSEIELNDIPIKDVVTSLQSWIDLAEVVGERYQNSDIEWNHKNALLHSEWVYWLREMKIKAADWDEIFLQSEQVYSTWIEIDVRSMPGSLMVYKRPIDVEEAVKSIFSGRRKDGGIIWTSGTMTVPKNERFIANQLGLSNTVKIHQYSAPASFYSGANVYIVDNMPDIQQVSQTDYIEAVADVVIQTALTTEGRCFVLFTSQDMLRKTVDLITDSRQLEDYMLIAQGITSGSRMRLLKSFQRFSKSILFGTNSFWEGVDVPGEALTAVVVVRLPFSSPEEPVFKARAKHLKSLGIQSFTSYALPEAVLRFRQGFGRLIRSSNDRGVFIILDRRIDKKSYGKDFLQSLPPVPVKKVTLEHMVLELENWYTKHV